MQEGKTGVLSVIVFLIKQTICHQKAKTTLFDFWCTLGIKLVSEPEGRRRQFARSLERVDGIEPTSSAWKAAALPLCYTRNDFNRNFLPAAK